MRSLECAHLKGALSHQAATHTLSLSLLMPCSILDAPTMPAEPSRDHAAPTCSSHNIARELGAMPTGPSLSIVAALAQSDTTAASG